MLIFDRFKNRQFAERFAKAVTVKFGLESVVCRNQRESNKIDPFPFELEPPIVLVERPMLDMIEAEFELESHVEGYVFWYGGRFAGT